MRPLPHVFVSSTFVDLKRHRLAVREIIQKLGAHDISMETLGARDNRPLAECVRLVKEESDIFVGIYAHRYGFVPDHSSVSITEAEDDAAVEVGIPCFVFLAASHAASAGVDGVDGSRVKLERFKTALAARRIVERFSSPQDLAAKVAAALGRHFRQQRLDDSFVSQLTAQYPCDRSADEIHQFVSTLVNDIAYWLQQTRAFPFVQLASEQVNQTFETCVRTVTSLPAAFFTPTPHRPDGTLRFETLEHAFSHARRRLLLTGSPGSGKTTALLTFARTAAERRLADHVAPVPLVARASTWTSNHTGVTQWLAEQIPALTLSTIEGLVARGQALLIVDGLDEVPGRKTKDDDAPPPCDPRRALLDALPRGGGVVITCRDDDVEMLVEGGAEFPVSAAVSLQSISDNDHLAMLRSRPQLAKLATLDNEFDRLTRNPLMLGLLLLAYDESSSAVDKLAGLEPSALRDSVIGHFIEKRFQHESMS